MKFSLCCSLAVAVLGVSSMAAADGAEHSRHTKKLFSALDGDLDGRISRDELFGGFTRHLTHKLEHRFQQLDRNRDGRVERDEVQGMDAARFSRFDLNHDGSFTQAELAVVLYLQLEQKLTGLLATADSDGDRACSFAELDAHQERLAELREHRRQAEPGRVADTGERATVARKSDSDESAF